MGDITRAEFESQYAKLAEHYQTLLNNEKERITNIQELLSPDAIWKIVYHRLRSWVLTIVVVGFIGISGSLLYIGANAVKTVEHTKEASDYKIVKKAGENATENIKTLLEDVRILTWWKPIQEKKNENILKSISILQQEIYILKSKIINL